MSGYIGPAPVPQSTQTREAFTATSGQTTFNTGGYTAGFIDVFMNGVKLAAADYTATNGSDVVLASGAATGDIIETVAYSAFTVADQDFTGDLTIDGDTFVVDSTNDRVGVGTSSPDTKLTVSGGDIKATGSLRNQMLVLERTDAANDYEWQIQGGSSSDSQYLAIVDNKGDAADERLRVDASGNLLVGTTSPDPAAPSNNLAGIALGSTGYLSMTRDGAVPVFFNRKTSDGDIAQFRKDGTTVGSIGNSGDNLIIGSTDVGLLFNSGANEILPATTIDTSDATKSLGKSNARFKDLYLSGGVYLGGTGSANKLDDYEEGTWTPTVLNATTNPSVTYSLRTGSYTKIGNMVFAFFDVTWTALSGQSGQSQLGGFPFTAAAAGNMAGYSAPVFRAASGVTPSANATDKLSGYIQGTTYSLEIDNEGSAGFGTRTAGTSWKSSGRITGYFVYSTNS